MISFLAKYKITIIILILALVVGAGAYLYRDQLPGGELLVRKEIDGVSGAVIGTQILRELNRLEKINLSPDVFSSEAFRLLTDYRQDIIASPVGRPDPYNENTVGQVVPEAFGIDLDQVLREANAE